MAVEVPSTAMVLAAGLGLRMRPLTLTTPKPLVQVAGRALIDHTLDRFAEASVATAVVNVHHLADQMLAHLAGRRRPRIIISDESAELLDSGGGVVKALPHLDRSRFFIANADSFWIDEGGANLRGLAATFAPEHMDALLLLVPTRAAVGFGGAGDFVIDAGGRLARRGARAESPYVYAGCGLIEAQAFAGAPRGRFSLNEVFDRALTAGRLYGYVLDGLWLHVGTPQAIPLAEAALAERRRIAS